MKTYQPSLKAFRIVTRLHRDGGYSVYSNYTAGAAKTDCLMSMRDAYPDASYRDILSCTRAPEHDPLAKQHPEKCIEWKNDNDHYYIEDGFARKV